MVLVEVHVKSYLASMVPVIVNAILNEHQVVVDIVAFVGKGDFPRSRLGEKQRGKILASWVTRKMRTIAQFGIRDAHTRMEGEHQQSQQHMLAQQQQPVEMPTENENENENEALNEMDGAGGSGSGSAEDAGSGHLERVQEGYVLTPAVPPKNPRRATLIAAATVAGEFTWEEDSQRELMGVENM